MKIYKVQYSGFEYVGTAIVIADNEEDAINKAKNHRLTYNFTNASVCRLFTDAKDGVIYNDNGAM